MIRESILTWTIYLLCSEARKSLNRPSPQKVLDNLIYNYKPTYCGKFGWAQNTLATLFCFFFSILGRKLLMKLDCSSDSYYICFSILISTWIHISLQTRIRRSLHFHTIFYVNLNEFCKDVCTQNCCELVPLWPVFDYDNGDVTTRLWTFSTSRSVFICFPCSFFMGLILNSLQLILVNKFILSSHNIN